MNRNSVRALLYEKYIAPTERPRNKAIGIEIEMPVVNLSGGPTDFSVTQAAAQGLYEQFGFACSGKDAFGQCYSATDPVTGDNLSFDCSYNNMELSFGKEQDLRILDRRFRDYVSFLNAQLRAEGHTLTGMGVNPRWDVNNNSFLPVPRYQMLQRYLSRSREWSEKMYFHPYFAFGAFASASQVQLDVQKDHLLTVLKAFSLVEPVKAVLFHNAYLSAEPELLCARDLFWENSTHGINPHNVGMYERIPETIDELLDYIATTSIFCAEREGRYLHFRPIPIVEYLETDTVEGEYLEDGAYKTMTIHPESSDLKYLRTYKFEDLTYRGTIEFRSVCCQPFSSAMSVAAFHMGLMDRAGELSELLERDDVLYHHGYNASELRKLMNRRNWPEWIDREKLTILCRSVLDLAKDGLREQGLGVEPYLEPLYHRAETLCSPARYMVEQLEAGAALNELILQYADLG
ncbi:MAG: glutamylcysteine synthetase [Oscillospiraceae bacterium]|nr:glutamylcysteine synthetase [Oscillospiraceae bacterium]